MFSYVNFDLIDGTKISVLKSNPFFQTGIGKELTNGGNLPFKHENMICLFYNVFPNKDIFLNESSSLNQTTVINNPNEYIFNWIIEHLEITAMLSLLYHEKICYHKLFQLARDNDEICKSKEFSNARKRIFENINLHDFKYLYNGTESEIFSKFLYFHLGNMDIVSYKKYVDCNDNEFKNTNIYIPEKFGFSPYYKEFRYNKLCVCHKNLLKNLESDYDETEYNLQKQINMIKKSMIIELLICANYELVNYILKTYNIYFPCVKHIMLYLNNFRSKKSIKDYNKHINFAIQRKDFELCKHWIVLMSWYYTSDKLSLKESLKCVPLSIFNGYQVLSTDIDNKKYDGRICIDRLMTFEKFIYDDNCKDNKIQGVYYDIKNKSFVRGAVYNYIEYRLTYNDENNNVLLNKYKSLGVLEFFIHHGFEFMLLKHDEDSDSEEDVLCTAFGLDY